MWTSAARRLRQMGRVLPGVSALMSAFDRILSALNQHNLRGKWFFQTERNKIPMVDVSPEQAAKFFYTAEVNLNQTTMPATAKVHAGEAKPKKIKGQSTELFEQSRTDKGSFCSKLSLEVRSACSSKASRSNPISKARCSRQGKG